MGFGIIKKLKDENIQCGYQPIDIVYIPDLQNVQGNLSIDKKGTVEHTNVYECYGCSQFFGCKRRIDDYLKICSKMPGVIYRFENQSLMTYEDNQKFLGDLSFAAYFDFEINLCSSFKILMEIF